MSVNSKYKLPLLLYDNDCVLCRRFKDALLKLPGTENIHVAPISNDEIYKIYPELHKEECFKELHILDEYRIIYKGPKALEYLIKLFPKVNDFSWLLESNAAQKGLDFFYSVANKLRESLKDDCPSCKNKKTK